MKTGFDYKQFERWAKNLGVAEDEFQVWLKMFLLEQAQRIVRAAKLKTPVDTGALINSYSIGSQTITLMDDPSGAKGVTSKGKPAKVIDPENSDIDSIAVVDNHLYVTIYNNMEYASYVEYGHHNYMGRYMLTIASDDVRKALPSRFEKQFNEWLSHKGVV